MDRAAGTEGGSVQHYGLVLAVRLAGLVAMSALLVAVAKGDVTPSEAHSIAAEDRGAAPVGRVRGPRAAAAGA